MRRRVNAITTLNQKMGGIRKKKKECGGNPVNHVTGKNFRQHNKRR